MSCSFAGLRFRLISIVLLAVLPALALILYTGFEQRSIAALEAQENAKRLVRFASMHQASVIQEARFLLTTLAEHPIIREHEQAPCSDLLSKVLRTYPHYVNFGLIELNGELLCSALPFSGYVGLADRDYFQRALETRDFAIGNCEIGRVSGKASLKFGMAVMDTKGQANAVLFSALDLAWLNELATHVRLPEGSTFTVIDPRGTVISRYPDPERWIGKKVPDTEIFKTVLDQKEEGLAEATGIDGIRRLYAFTPLDEEPHSMFLYTGVPVKTVFAKANRILTRNLVALGVVSALVLAAARLFGYLFVMRWVDVLVSAARQLASGDLSIRTGLASGNGEINQLGQAFDEMAESLRRRGAERDQMEEALRKSEAKYRTLVEQIPAITYVAALDDASTTLYMSPQVETLLGFEQQDYLSDPDLWRKKLHPDDREHVLAEVARCRTDDDMFFCEYRMLTRNNYVRWLRDEAVIVHGDAGEPLFLQGFMLDITDQKLAEEALREAHDKLELRVEQRTAEITKANEELRRNAEKMKLFAYSVVHDLKSPTIGAYGLAKLLQRQYRDVLDDKARHYCDQILRASEHVAELVEKINVFIATKEARLRIEKVSLGEILQMVRDEFSSRLNLRQVTCLQPETSIEIRADRLSLLRVFRNYIDNALKYGGEQLSEIRIGYEESELFHIFSVSDNGAGVKKERSEKIFDPFHRNGSSNGIEGAGLGLAIVREIAEQHRGKVWMESGPDRGVTFYFSIVKNM